MLFSDQTKNIGDFNQSVLYVLSKFGESALNSWLVMVRASSVLQYARTRTHTLTRTNGGIDTKTIYFNCV